VARQSLKEGPFMPRARVLGMATAGVSPRVMGIGPAPAVRQVLAMTGLSLADMSVIELNEAFAATAFICEARAMRSWASRSIWYSSATFSAVSGMESTP
jgi:acetyl-CoA acetyltransferase